MGEVFDFAGVFDEDYLYFYREVLPEERSDADADVVWRMLELAPGMRVLDLACGHGRIANRLAARGCLVTGLDVTPTFLDVARADAVQRGVEVEYVLGDMRDLPWVGEFDRIYCWFTAYGYFDDADNRTVLRQVAKALRPGGRFLLDVQNRDWIVRALRPVHVIERGDDFLIDRSHLHPHTGAICTKRIVVRHGQVRRTSFFVRLFTFTELRDWLIQAGLRDVEGYGEAGQPLTMDSHRLVMVAHC